MEYKGFKLEIKEINEQGEFKGLLSTYNFVDSGGDRVNKGAFKNCLDSTGKKKIKLLWQHDTKTPIGSGTISDSPAGLMIDGKLNLLTTPQGFPKVPKAHEAHALLINKDIDELSMGYITQNYKYNKVDGQTVRDLLDVDVLEGSIVTFAMNSQCKVSEAKANENVIQNIENKKEGENQVEDKEKKTTEEKAMGFTQILKLQQAQNMRWRLQDALNDSFRQLMNDDTMKVEDKVTQLNANVDDFAKSYKEIMTQLLQASAASKAAKKEIEQSLETKSNETQLETKDNQEPQETKAGKKISKANKTKLSQCKDALGDLMATIAALCEDESTDDGDDPEDGKSKKTPPVKTPPKEDPKDDEKDPNKQKSQNNDNIQLKSAFDTLLKTIKGN